MNEEEHDEERVNTEGIFKSRDRVQKRVVGCASPDQIRMAAEIGRLNLVCSFLFEKKKKKIIMDVFLFSFFFALFWGGGSLDGVGTWVAVAVGCSRIKASFPPSIGSGA
ncbi:hypothetical protein IE53DRAFT_184472 [Violaceomyces palustris]|uniref:Uncharacterized protein n=1 Tax=Violaceomyces palustris TaxID=1673888 RepID=A0ACD0NS56_9BASI|nr:hypothetical protein IE53DRAFT_184472 [Violaceomyces palustris]